MCQIPACKKGPNMNIPNYKLLYPNLVGRYFWLQYPRCHLPTICVEYPPAWRYWGSSEYSVDNPVGWNLSIAPLCLPMVQAYRPVRRAAREGEHLGWTSWRSRMMPSLNRYLLTWCFSYTTYFAYEPSLLATDSGLIQGTSFHPKH